jgi:hypothetical protein
VFVAEVPHNSSPNSPVDHNRQSQCCSLTSGSCTGFHCSEVLGLRSALKFSSTAQACGNVESQTC